MNCSMCHGTLDNQPSPLEKSFYPPALQLILDPQADPEWRINYAVRSEFVTRACQPGITSHP
jgi:hypothetical protein